MALDCKLVLKCFQEDCGRMNQFHNCILDGVDAFRCKTSSYGMKIPCNVFQVSKTEYPSYPEQVQESA